MNDNVILSNPRPPFCHGRNKYEIFSPIADCKAIFSRSANQHQKQACLRYLIQYQHYNAEYTREENETLGYPKPLNESQEKHGYFRTEYNRLVHLLQSYTGSTLTRTDFYQFCERSFVKRGKKSIDDFIKISTKSAIDVFEMFYSSGYSIKSIDQLKEDDLGVNDNKIIVIGLSPFRIKDNQVTAFRLLDEGLGKIGPKGVQFSQTTNTLQGYSIHFPY